MNDYEREISRIFELKGTPVKSRESYNTRMNVFLNYLTEHQKKVEEITVEDIQDFLLHLIKEKKLAPGTVNNYNSAIKFFYTHILDKEWSRRKLPRMRRDSKLPVVPPREEIVALIDSITNLKHKSVVSLLYGSGLRVGEAVSVKIGDICSKTMRVRIDKAKHNTTRSSILSEKTVEILREYFKQNFTAGYQLDEWLFPGQNPGEHLTDKSIKNTIIKYRDKLNLNPEISAHTLRHAFATHSMEAGTNLDHIKELLGHKSIASTAVYLHMTSKSMMGIKSPLDMGEAK